MNSGPFTFSGKEKRKKKKRGFSIKTGGLEDEREFRERRKKGSEQKGKE